MSKTRTFIFSSLALFLGIGLGVALVIVSAYRIERRNRMNESLVLMAPCAAVGAELEALRHLRRGDTNAAIAELLRSAE